MSRNLVASVSMTVPVSSDKVWKALVDPGAIKQYMFGTTVVSDWQEGSPIYWRGEWQGKPYEDKGVILKFKPGRTLQYTHFSPLSGVPDLPENYHTVTVELKGGAEQTAITLTQDHNANDEEREHSEKNWDMMLSALKKFLES